MKHEGTGRIGRAVRHGVVRLVVWSVEHAPLVAVLGALLTLVCVVYAAGNLPINADTNGMISNELPVRRFSAEFDRIFPQGSDLLVVVIDAATADEAADAAAALARRLAAQPSFFRAVERPDAAEIFRRNGLLFLSVPALTELADQLVAAQPMVGTLAADPTARGVLEAVDLVAEGLREGDFALDALEPALDELAASVEAAIAGRKQRLSWQQLLTGQEPDAGGARRFLLVKPVLDYGSLTPGAAATERLRAEARALGLTPENGIRVRLTGSVALSDEEFATVSEGAGSSTALAFATVCILLLLALHSPRLIVAILGTLIAGLAVTAGFAALAIGQLNVISVAFGVLYIGVAVDFGVQFAVRYRDERYRDDNLRSALRRAAGGVATPLLLAGGATIICFYSFVPTNYRGVAELGIIAGTSIVIALVLNLSLLPALIALLRPPGETAPAGYAWAAPIDAFLLRRRRGVLAIAAGIAAMSLAAVPGLRFDFDPLNLKDPQSESMATALDLMRDETSTPYTIDALAPSAEAAAELAARLEKLPEVRQVLTVASFVPGEQEEKLAIIRDLALLLGPSLAPRPPPPAPSDAELRAALEESAAALRRASAAPPAAGRLAAALESAAKSSPAVVGLVAKNIASGIEARLDEFRDALAAEPLTLETMSPDFKRKWVAEDGRARLEIYPAIDPRDPAALRRFVAAVRTIVPEVSGMPPEIIEAGDAVLGAFFEALAIAGTGVALMLLVILRRPSDALRTVAPLGLAALLSAATCAVTGLPITFANIIILPLLLSETVSYSIYFVERWRSGAEGLLQSSTARAVVFTALTTIDAFGSLAFSRHPGTADMGKLIAIALLWTLAATLLFLPALLGPSPGRR
ncbi:MAG: MMPL family transporter [Rhodospirillales bacterium]|nr:MMPL family transporter [Rhodospirillales bacterium]